MPDASDDKTLSLAPGETSFSCIGPYWLVQRIGVGGMGEVWRAEQTAPFHRIVALKLIKAGMDTRAALARFESERQALALMEHPNIAKVFDAGATPEGRPYFVMECVPGLPITSYCDRHRLTIRDRLALFTQVCDGVQHAHPTIEFLVTCPAVNLRLARHPAGNHWQARPSEGPSQLLQLGVFRLSLFEDGEPCLSRAGGVLVGGASCILVAIRRLTPVQFDVR